MDLLHRLRSLTLKVPAEMEEDDYLGDERPKEYDKDIPQDEGDAHAAVTSNT